MLTHVKCPSCKQEAKWEENPFRPFCSDRCRTLDLGAWMSGRYRIPEQGDDTLPDDGEDEDL